VHADRLGGNRRDFALTAQSSEQDGTYYYGGGLHRPESLTEPGVIAYWSRRLAPASPDDAVLPGSPAKDDPENRFGSWHVGRSFFLMGDGSMQPMAHSTSSRVLQQLGCRNDGA
jgi:hypothetical protein